MGVALATALVLATGSVLAAQPDWQPIECIPADLSPEQMFEVAQTVEDFEGHSPKWTAAVGSQQAKAAVRRDTAEHHGGAAALCVEYEFAGKRDYEYIQVGGPAEFAKPGLGFGFWLKHDGTPFWLKLRTTDASGECHQTDLLHSNRPGWQFVAGTLDGESTSWGGDGNRRKDYPLKLLGIVVDRPRVGFVGKGRLWIDDAAVLRTRELPATTVQVQVKDGRFGNVYSVGDTVSLRASGSGEQVRWHATDFFDREVAWGEGAASGVEVRFPLSRPGWFCCRIEMLAGGRVVNTRLFQCAALPRGDEPVRSDFVGVCTHYGHSTYPLETMDLICRYGIDQYRDEISWRGYEREKGRYAMPQFAAAYLQHSAKLHMRPLIIFDYNNPHYDGDGFPNSPEAIAAFGRYAVDLTRQTRGTVKMFEVWNEWVGGCGMNGRSGQHDGEAYGRLLRPAYEAVKRAFPDVTVVGIGGEYGHKCAENILGAVRTAGPDAMDGWSIHPYRYPRPPESSDLTGEVGGIAAKVAAAGVKTKAWITEIGYPTHRTSGGCDEAAQARYCVRTLALLQSTRLVEKVFWYDLKNDGLKRDYNEDNFGLIHHQRFRCAPKPAMVAMSAFIRMTAGAEFQELRRDGGLHTARYRRPDSSEVLLAWTERGVQPLIVTGQVAAAWDLMGDRLAGAAQPEASEAVIYLTGRGLSVRRPR